MRGARSWTMLEQMGFEVEAAHHEVAHGQHEIDFRYADALTTADNIATFRFVVKHVAQQFGLIASFMPKPIFGQNGSGMHTHQSLFTGKAERVLGPEGASGSCRETALHYIGGLLRHARGMLRDHEPARELVQAAGAGLRGAGERRVVDAQPLADDPRSGAARAGHARRAAHARSGGEPVPRARGDARGGARRRRDEGRLPRAGERRTSGRCRYREKRRLRIDDLPHDLNEACDELEKDDVITDALGEHIAQHFLAAKRQEWREYITQVIAVGAGQLPGEVLIS